MELQQRAHAYVEAHTPGALGDGAAETFLQEVAMASTPEEVILAIVRNPSPAHAAAQLEQVAIEGGRPLPGRITLGEVRPES